MFRLKAILFFPIALAASLASCAPSTHKPLETVTVVRVAKPEIPVELRSCAWVEAPPETMDRESQFLAMTIDFALAWADCYRKLTALNRLLSSDVAAIGQ